MIRRLWAVLFGPPRTRLGIDTFEMIEGTVKVEGLTITGPSQAVQNLIILITRRPGEEIQEEGA